MLTLPDAFISDPKFKADFQAFSNASSEEEKNRIIEERRRWRASLTPEQKAEADAIARRSADEMLAAAKANLEELDARITRQRLDTLADGLSLAYIVQHYMGHTKEWLYQRMNGAIVNGKPARFKTSELEQLQQGIRDYGARLAAVSLVP